MVSKPLDFKSYYHFYFGSTVFFKVCLDNKTAYIATIYGSMICIKRRNLWQGFVDIQANVGGSWLFIGYFNAILGPHEKKGGLLPLKDSCDDFLNWTYSNDLTHIVNRGENFT